MSTLTSRQIQAQNTKELILKVSSDLLKEKILDDISIKEICNAANVSIGAFYHHFQNKESIIMELYKDIDKYFEEEIIPKLMDKEPIEAIIDYLCYQCKYACDTGLDLVQNTYKAQMNNASSFFLSSDRGLPNGLRSIIIKAQNLGRIRDDLSVDEVTDELLIISRGVIYHWCVSDGKSDIMHHVRNIGGNYLRSCLQVD